MARFLRVLTGILIVLLLGLAGAAISVRNTTTKALTKTYDADFALVPIPDDPAAIKEGERLVRMKGCYDCHGPNLEGAAVIDDPAIGYVAASNLTGGKGGVGRHYGDRDWIRAIRYGLNLKRQPLLIMPSHEYNLLSNEDLSRMIAFLKRLPPKDNEVKPHELGPLAYLLYAMGQMPTLIPVEQIDFKRQHPEAVTPSASEEYGKYLSAACIGCHREDFSGGRIVGLPPDWPPAANLTPAGGLPQWQLADFIQVMRHGKTPDGRELNPKYMPWKSMGYMNDIELEALYRFFKTIPAKATPQ